MGWITVKCSKCGGSGYDRSGGRRIADYCTECRGRGTNQENNREQDDGFFSIKTVFTMLWYIFLAAFFLTVLTFLIKWFW